MTNTVHLKTDPEPTDPNQAEVAEDEGGGVAKPRRRIHGKSAVRSAWCPAVCARADGPAAMPVCKKIVGPSPELDTSALPVRLMTQLHSCELEVDRWNQMQRQFTDQEGEIDLSQHIDEGMWDRFRIPDVGVDVPVQQFLPVALYLDRNRDWTEDNEVVFVDQDGDVDPTVIARVVESQVVRIRGGGEVWAFTLTSLLHGYPPEDNPVVILIRVSQTLRVIAEHEIRGRGLQPPGGVGAPRSPGSSCCSDPAGACRARNGGFA